MNTLSARKKKNFNRTFLPFIFSTTSWHPGTAKPKPQQPTRSDCNFCKPATSATRQLTPRTKIHNLTTSIVLDLIYTLLKPLIRSSAFWVLTECDPFKIQNVITHSSYSLQGPGIQDPRFLVSVVWPRQLGSTLLPSKKSNTLSFQPICQSPYSSELRSESDRSEPREDSSHCIRNTIDYDLPVDAWNHLKASECQHRHR